MMDTPDIANAEYWLEVLRMVRNAGAALVVLGVAMELLGDWFAKPYERTVENARVAELARTTESAAKAGERAAQAEARAAEANLELAKLKAPRTLSEQQRNRITAKLEPFKGTTFEIVTYPGEPEPVAFSDLIATMLTNAGWVSNPNKASGSLMGLASGVVVVVGKQAGQNAEQAGMVLLNALKSEGVMAKLAYGSLQVNPIPIAIELQVAKKP